MRIEKTGIEGCFIIHPKIYKDERGYFYESFNRKDFKNLSGCDINFIQDNESKSSKNVLRGIHFQTSGFEQSKLVRVVSGSVFDVAVDLRTDSSTFGEYVAVTLSSENHKQLFVPKGFGHGFLVLSDTAILSYKVDEVYKKEYDSGIKYNDPDLKINWPLTEEPIISPKDASLGGLKDFLNNF